MADGWNPLRRTRSRSRDRQPNARDRDDHDDRRARHPREGQDRRSRWDTGVGGHDEQQKGGAGRGKAATLPAWLTSDTSFGSQREHPVSSSSSNGSNGSSSANDIRTTNESAAATNTSTLNELRAVAWGGEVADTEMLTSGTAAVAVPAPAPADSEVDKVKADFGLSGALAKDVNTGNMYNGVVLKWTEPLDSAKPTKQWRLYVVKNGDVSETLHLHRQSAYLFGRDTRVADVVLQHESCSKQHAVLQYRAVSAPAAAPGAEGAPGAARRVVKPYIMDLGSTHKTFLNGSALEDARYYELRERDVLRFAGSTRDYILLHEESSNL